MLKGGKMVVVWRMVGSCAIRSQHINQQSTSGMCLRHEYFEGRRAAVMV